MPLIQLRILIAIDQHMFSNGLLELFRDNQGLPVCNIINCSEHLIRSTFCENHDMAIIDLNSPDINGKTAIKRILKSFANARINMLSLYVDTNLIEQIKEAGVKGSFQKKSKAGRFMQTIQFLISGDEYQAANYHDLFKDDKVHLSKREEEVLRLIVGGYTNPEIAEKLHIKPCTVKEYRKNLFYKLKVHTSAELVAICMREGYI